MIVTHLRFTAGACLLAVGLMMGAGGLVALADPGAHDSASNSNNGGSGQQSSTGEKEKKEKEPKKADNGTGGNATAGSGGQSDDQASAGATSPTAAGATSPTAAGAGRNGSTVGSGGRTDDQVSAGTTSPNTAPADAGSRAQTNHSGRVGAVAQTVDAVTAVAALVPTAVSPSAEPVVPVSGVAAPVGTMAGPVSDVAAVRDGPLTPVGDIVALIEDMFTSVSGAVVGLTQMQSDFAAFLFETTGVPVVDASGRIDGDGLSAAVHAWVAAQSPQLVALAAIPGTRSTGHLAGSCATIPVCPESSPPAVAPLAFDGAVPTGMQSFFRRADGQGLLSASGSAAAFGRPGAGGLVALAVAAVLPVSLAALAAVALPGLGGWVTVTAAGVRIGYRQASAGYGMRNAGIARFAHPGTLGVAHSGSLVGVRPRALHVTPPPALSAGYLLDKVA
jgi:hypothetical protein